MNKILSKLGLVVLFWLLATFLILPLFFKNLQIKAQEAGYACIGRAVAKYMNTVIERTNAAGGLRHIKLLSPAFNLTNPATQTILNSMKASRANWKGLTAYSGNAYHVSGRPIMYWVNQFYTWVRSLDMPSKRLIITETGDHDCSTRNNCTTQNYQNLGQEINVFRQDSHFLGALFFNVFNTNDNWRGFAIPPDQINNACGGSCANLGANSATYYPEREDFYNKANDAGMTYTLSISNADESTTQGVLLALNKGLIPIIRIGTRETSGPEAEAYANYLINLDRQLPEGSVVYAIAGPNEPDSEYWVAPECFAIGSGGEPPPNYIRCDQTTDNEWHSLRPYRASPCNLQAMDLALFCGNDFILMDSFGFTKTYDFSQGVNWSYQYQPTPGVSNPIDPFPREGPPTACGYCDESRKCIRRSPPCDDSIGCDTDSDCQTPASPCYSKGNGTETCYFNVHREKNIKVDLSGSYFPIMGLTEDPYVVNLQTPKDQVDDNQKVNEYVSWYLNGLLGRAEYGRPETQHDGGALDTKKIVNFSGPLKKLLSFDSQIVRRIEEVQKSLEDKRHNQIIGCWVKDVFQTWDVVCPHNPRIDKGKMRLEDWKDKLPPVRKAFETFEEYWNAFKGWRKGAEWKLFPYIPFSSTEDRLGRVEIETYSVPPPTTGQGVILFNELVNQKPADLFFAHMQEVKELGKLFQKIFTPERLAQPGGAIDAPADPQVVPYQPFCDILEIRSNPGDDLFAGEFSATLKYDTQTNCDFYYPYPTPGAPEGNVCQNVVDKNATCQTVPDNYDCNKYYGQIDCASGRSCAFDCKPLPTGNICDEELNKTCYPSDWTSCSGIEQKIFRCPDPTGGSCQNRICENGGTCAGKPCTPGTMCLSQYCPPGQDCWFDTCPSGYTCASSCTRPIDTGNNLQSCPIQISAPFKTVTKTPLADQVWARLVAGPASVFRRIFPQIKNELGRPLKALWDIPGASPVTYTSLDGTTVLAGNPKTGRLGENAELYFPHIGAIHEYFLRCIQKTLRPKGFGEGCTSVPESILNPPPPPQPPPPGSTRCQLGTGLCAPSGPGSAIASAGFTGCRANQASIICNVESGGDASVANLGCTTGRSLDYSIGLFQINLLAHCEGAFNYGWGPPPWCTVLDQDKVDACENTFYDPDQNAAYAYTLSNGGENWSPWAAYDVCRTEIDRQCPNP